MSDFHTFLRFLLVFLLVLPIFTGICPFGMLGSPENHSKDQSTEQIIPG
jgi:hypothetical protein